MKKRILAMLLSAAIAASAVPAPVWAEEAGTIAVAKASGQTAEETLNTEADTSPEAQAPANSAAQQGGEDSAPADSTAQQGGEGSLPGSLPGTAPQPDNGADGEEEEARPADEATDAAAGLQKTTRQAPGLQTVAENTVATVQSSAGDVQYYDTVSTALDAWRTQSGSTLTLLPGTTQTLKFMDLPDEGTLDLGGNSVALETTLDISGSLTVRNGELKVTNFLRVEANGVLSLEKLKLSGRDENSSATIENKGTIIDLGGVELGEGIDPSSAVSYMDETGAVKVLFAPYTLINSSESAPTGWSNGWYVAEGSVTISDRVTVNGSVNLILKDGAKLIAEQGITVSEGNSFAVYTQSTGDNMGWLQATNAESTDSAALGGEMGSAGSITINGGTVTGTAINGAGIGGGEDADDAGKFSTSKMNGDPGNAVIFAGSITDTSDKDNWSGLIFLNNTGSIYGGNSYTLNNDIDLSWNQTLTIEDGETFTVAGGVTLNNEGHIMIRTGGSYIGGLIGGNQVEFEIQWDIDGDGSTNESTFVAYGQIPSHADGVKNSTEPEKYVNVFDRWEPALVEATQPACYSAQFTPTEVLYKVTMPAEAGCKVQYAGSSAVPYETKITFTVELADGYRKTGDFAVLANGVPLQEEGDGSYRLTVTEDIEITVEGVEAIPATPTPTATPAPTAVPGPVEIPVKAPW